MFKPARWRSDKNKIKAVFKLEFHATKVSWSGGDTLMISVIPAEGGKPTSILDKVKIQDGSCYWEKPVYETMKVTRNPKTGKINERLYHVIFSTGLSKFGLLGEVSINFADYAVATKLSSLSLPIKNTKFEAVLHVTIERIQDSVGQREFEDGENLKDDPKDQSLRAHLSNSDIDESIKTNDSEEGSFRGDPRALIEELRQELNHEKDLSANLRIQLQKTRESNTELILAVQDLDEMLEEKNREILDLSNRSATTENSTGIWETNSRSSADLDEDQKALEKLVMEHTNVKDTYMQEQKIIDLCGEVEIYKRERDDLEMQLEQLALDYEIMKQENHDMSNELKQSQLQDQLNMQFDCSECATSYFTIKGLETKIASLENELKEQSKEFSNSLLNISELENQVKGLEEELEKQAQGFEADLENLTHLKVEQEQRAIRAEENLRKTRWQNANTADRLQEEFRRLSEQMASTFNANERLATKALTEANELRLEKTCLDEMLRQAKEEVQSVKEHYEAKLVELSRQLELKLNHVEKLQEEVAYKSTEFKNQRKHAEETQKTLSQKLLLLQSEIGRLDRVNNVSCKQTEENETLRAELEQMKASIRDTEKLLEEGAAERKTLESMAALLKMEAQNSLEELNVTRNAKDETKLMTENLQSELATLKVQYNELKIFSTAEESQKEKYQKQVIQLKGELKKKEDALSIVEKKIKDCNGGAPVSEVAKARNNIHAPSPHASKELVGLKDKIKLLEGKIKLKEVALEKSSNTFLVKEQDLQRKIKDLEKTVEILNQNAASFSGHECPKVHEDSGNLDAGIREAAIYGAQNSTTMKCTTEKMGYPRSLTERNNDIPSNNEIKDSGTDSRDCKNLEMLLNEVVLLKEKNQSMECELRDMQQRYSDISLKFAEVEGERQQLVMTLRNFKNSNKSWSPFT
ncbi:Early endosome antigen 1-like [Heracleum sosnowskyi]|uniref:Early endosome antigen 1-like n=1 Tax=Heracleum sosnowskyi TaxID=360622 RepID=A0AAD8LXK6_9APIA|nr:Early endosome antigen 1-like [Heracleum sosnowskyi]